MSALPSGGVLGPWRIVVRDHCAFEQSFGGPKHGAFSLPHDNHTQHDTFCGPNDDHTQHNAFSIPHDAHAHSTANHDHDGGSTTI